MRTFAPLLSDGSVEWEADISGSRREVLLNANAGQLDNVSRFSEADVRVGTRERPQYSNVESSLKPG
jgi:hypothetical protein